MLTGSHSLASALACSSLQLTALTFAVSGGGRQELGLPRLKALGLVTRAIDLLVHLLSLVCPTIIVLRSGMRTARSHRDHLETVETPALDCQFRFVTLLRPVAAGKVWKYVC